MLRHTFNSKNPIFGGFSECLDKYTDFDKLVCELEGLRKIGDMIVNSSANLSSYQAHPWTVLKLVFLKMYVRDVYTPIIGRRYPFMAFIDPFAGTGLNAYKNAEFYMPGSSLVAWSFATYPFNKIYAIGYRQDYIALKQRLERFIPKEYQWVKKGDANEVIDNIIDDLLERKEEYKGVHYLAFIDPESTEVHWNTLEKLVSLEGQGVAGDFIILLQARLIARTIGKIRKGQTRENTTEKLELFFGTEKWKKLLSLSSGEIEEGVKQFYINRLKKLKSKALIEIINIELMRRNIHYYLIYITRKTKGGAPYLETVRWLKQFVEKVDKKEVVGNAINKVLGIRLLPDYIKST